MASKSTPDEESKTMRAWVYKPGSGGFEHNLHLTDAVPRPGQPLAKDELLVKVRSASLNPADYKIQEMGRVARAVIPVTATPGIDFAGTVAARGDAVKDTLRVGDAVFGRVKPGRSGTLGEYVVATQRSCVRLAAGLNNMDEASCVGTAGLTAYQSIVPNAKEGDKVFINGGSGGTGTFGIQIAKAVGCHVVTSCSGRNADLCRGLGADEVVDYATQDVNAVLKAKGAVFKLVVDNVGHGLPGFFKAANHFLLPEGKFVQVGAPISVGGVREVVSRALLPSFLGGGKRSWQFLMVDNKPEDLEAIGNWMAQCKVKPVIDEVFAFEDAPKAFEKLKTGRTRGKIVVRVSE